MVPDNKSHVQMSLGLVVWLYTWEVQVASGHACDAVSDHKNPAAAPRIYVGVNIKLLKFQDLKSIRKQLK